MRAEVQPGGDVPLSSRCLLAVGQLTTTGWRSLEGSSIQKIQGEDLKVTKAFLLSRDKLAWCFDPALKHCLLPARFLFPPWNWLW